MILLSRILGMVRDVVIANVVGAGAGADVFLFANRIPNFLRRLFAEGAFSQAFVPVLTDYQQQGQVSVTRHFIQRVFGTLGGIVTLVTLAAVLLSPLVTLLFGFGWFLDWLRGGPEAAKYLLASQLLRLTFPYLWFITLVAFSGAILNTLDQFSVAAFSPVLLNIAMISCALWLAPQLQQPEIGLAVGVFLGGLLQLLFQIPFLRRAGLLVWPRWDWQDAGVRKIGRLMLPALFGVSVNQITLLLGTVIASFMVTGTISWLYYADRLLELPLGLVGATLSTILLPVLARCQARQAPDHFFTTLDWGIRILLLLGIPAMLGLMVLAEPVLMVLYLHGKFGMPDLQATTAALQGLNRGIVSILLAKILACAYYAQQDTKTPVRYGIITMVSNLLFSGALAWKFGYVGLAMATSLSSTLNAGLLYRGLVRRGIYRLPLATRLLILRVVLASGGMALVIQQLAPKQLAWLAVPLLTRIGWLSGLVAVALLVYMLLLLLLGVRRRHLINQLLPAHSLSQ